MIMIMKYGFIWIKYEVLQLDQILIGPNNRHPETLQKLVRREAQEVVFLLIASFVTRADHICKSCTVLHTIYMLWAPTKSPNFQ